VVATAGDKVEGHADARVRDHPLGGVPAPRRHIPLVEVAGGAIYDGVVVAGEGRRRGVLIRVVQRDVDRAEAARGVPGRRPATGRVESAEVPPDVGGDVDGEVGLVPLAPDGVDALAIPTWIVVGGDDRDDRRKAAAGDLRIQDPRQVELADPVAGASGIAMEQLQDRKSPRGLGRLEVGGWEVDQRLSGHAGTTGAAEPYLDDPALRALSDV